MSRIATTERIMNQLRQTDKPAMSAADLAEDLDVSVKTVNNNVEKLDKRGEIETTTIGNASAYYIPDTDLPAHKKPDHTCHRCGREADDMYDMAKIDLEVYFSATATEPETPNFYILCRFCYSDLVSWLYRDEGSMGNYSRAHSWNIPISQLRQIRDETEIVTRPDEPDQYLDDYKTTGYRIFEEMVDDRDETIEVEKLRENLRKELSSRESEKAIQYLENCGHVYRTKGHTELLPAK